MTALALLLILALAAALRLYRITQESVWWDEYTSLMHLGAPNLLSFLKFNRTLDPATLPLYYAMEYLWWHGVAASVTGLRGLSVLLSLATVGMLYLLGRECFGRGAALASALFLAISPVHIFHAQGIRMYVLMTLLAACSVYSLLKVMRAGRGWWALHAAVNFLLLWTHPFALLLLGVEGLFLLFSVRRHARRFLAWAFCHAVLALPSALYLGSIQFWPKDQTQTWMKMPSLLEFLADVFADDAVSLTYQLRISGRVWPALAALHPLLDAALFAAVLASLAFLCWRSFVQKKGGALVGFLLCWLILPPLALYAASLVSRPCIFPRYTLHCSLALYLALGGVWTLLPGRPLKTAYLLLAAALLASQTALMLPGPQRTDWRAAVARIRQEATPQDLVLVKVSIYRDVFVYNWNNPSLPIATAETEDVLAEQASVFLHLDYAKNARAWVVMATPYFDAGPNPAFEEAARSRGLEFSLSEMGGMEHVLVYRLRLGVVPGAAPDARKTAALNSSYDYSEGMADVALALAAQGQYAPAQAVLRQLVKKDHSPDPVYADFMSALETGKGVEQKRRAVCAVREGYKYRGEAALRQFKEALTYDPDCAAAHAELGLALLYGGKPAEALASLRRAGELNGEYAFRYGHLADVIAQNGDVQAALDCWQELLQAIPLMGQADKEKAAQALEHARLRDPAAPLPYLLEALLRLQAGDQPGFLDALHLGFRADPEHAGQWQPFVKALFEDKDYAAARRELATLRERKIYIFPDLIEELQKADPALSPAASGPANNTSPGSGS